MKISVRILFNFIFIFNVFRAQVHSSTCQCTTKESLQKADDHLRLLTRLQSIKIVPKIRDIMQQSSKEKVYLLERSHYQVLRDLHNSHGKIITEGTFPTQFEILVDSIKTVMLQPGNLTLHEIHSATTISLQKFLSSILPSTFMCMVLGQCGSYNPEYMECMTKNSASWVVHFGKEPSKIVHRLSETIHRFRLAEQILDELHSDVTSAEKKITPSCVARYATVTDCNACVSDGTGYCRSSCYAAVDNCFSTIDTEWRERISALGKLTTSYDDGLHTFERGIQNSLRKLLETNSPKMAQSVVELCGPLQQAQISPRHHSYPIQSLQKKKPPAYPRTTRKLVQQLEEQSNYWSLLSQKICADPSDHPYCWNGTNIARSEFLPPNIDLPSLKNVRPRPVDPLVDGSGVPPDFISDDEDFVEGSGSGNEPETIIKSDSESDVQQTATYTPVTFSPRVTPSLGFSDVAVGSDSDSVSDPPSTFKKGKPDSATSSGFLTSIVISVLSFLLFC